jgi:hypothetical protein
MSIDIPPEMPPVLMHLEKSNDLRRVHKTPFYIGRVGKEYVEILDLPYLTREQIERLAMASSNPSQLIVNLAKVYRLNGNLLVQILYRQQANTIYIYGIQTKLADIDAHPIVRDHFENLIGDEDLTIGEFEYSRVMADLGTERRGIDYSIAYTLSADYTETTLNFKPMQKEADRFQSSFDAGNQGNRFAGRKFAGLGFRYWSKWGTQYNMNYLTALSSKAYENTDTSFDGLVLAMDHPFSSGLYGLQASFTRYTSESTEVAFQPAIPQLCDLSPDLPICELGSEYTTTSDLEANTAILNTSAEHIIASGSGRRWVLSEKLKMVADEIVDPAKDAALIDERYATAAIGLKYLYGGRGRHGLSEGYYGLHLSGGFGDNSGSFVSDKNNLDVNEASVHPSKRSPNFIQLSPKFDLKFGLLPYFIVGAYTEGVFSNDTQVPQQEQYVLGGMDKLSAYLPGVLVGDSGFLSRLSIAGNSRKPKQFQIIPTLFVEHGEVWFEDAEGQAGRPRSLADAGLRIQLFFSDAGSLELVMAHPLSSRNVPVEFLKNSEVDFFARLKFRI